MHYKAPLRDMNFVLNQVFSAQQQWQQLGELSEVSEDIVAAILEEGGRIAETLLAPINREGDEVGAQFNDGQVTTPPGFKNAFSTMAEGGWLGLVGDPNYGGQGMPKGLAVLFEEMMFGANTSLYLIPVLTVGATMAIASHASEELKQTYLPPMYEGRWAGTMCLTEAHSGTDLGILRSRAVPQADGSYAISGSKIFITGGEQDYTDNIIHLVLAKLPDAPKGSGGISLFLVPKFLPNADGSLGERNSLSCGSIEHKMGIKASPTAVMNFDSAKGFLIGEVNAGLAAMFIMMNYERLSIGIQGVGAGEAAYQNAVAYALERIQGRSPQGITHTDKAADPIIVHPDVRRMLLSIRAYTEAGRAFAVYNGLLLDTAKHSADPEQAKTSQNLAALLTPVAKAFMSDKGLENCIAAQQVFGGHGYIREWGVEQHVRDVRIAQIYEGANGIQALDLMARKIARDGGATLAILFAEIRQCCESQQRSEQFSGWSAAVATALNSCEATLQWVFDNASDDKAIYGSASVDYLSMLAHTIYGYLWLRMGVAAADGDDEFSRSKIQTGEFYIKRLLPIVASLETMVCNHSDVLMAMDAEQFQSV